MARNSRTVLSIPPPKKNHAQPQMTKKNLIFMANQKMEPKLAETTLVLFFFLGGGVSQAMISCRSLLIRTHPRNLSGSRIRAVQCYDCPVAETTPRVVLTRALSHEAAGGGGHNNKQLVQQWACNTTHLHITPTNSTAPPGRLVTVWDIPLATVVK